MRKRHLLALGLLIYFSNYAYSQTENVHSDLKQIVEVCIKKYNRALSGHYSVESAVGSSYNADTTFIQSETYFLYNKRKKKYFDYYRSSITSNKAPYHYSRIINLDSMAFIQAENVETTKMKLDKKEKRFYFPEAAYLPFIGESIIPELFLLFKKTLINETEYSWIMEMNMSKKGINRFTFEISKADTLLLWMKAYKEDDSGWFYNEYHILYQELNQPAFSDLSLYQLPASGQAVYPDPADIQNISETTPNVQPGDPLSLPPFPTIQGDTLSLSDFKGKVVLLDFWYIGCGPCVDALPALQQLQNKYKDQGLVVIGLETYQPDPAKITRFLQARDVDYLQCYGPGVKEWSRQMQIQAFPTHFLLDREGRVVEVGSGYSPTLMRQSERRIVKLLETQP